ncbi:MAG: four helix bundle protein [Flavobacterium sp.]|nr:MAG: four helix bundle protein [Flavobacterium sp.]
MRSSHPKEYLYDRHKYQELIVWELSRRFCTTINKITATYPKEETFGLISQLRRAVISIPSNIAEGASRSSNTDL